MGYRWVLSYLLSDGVNRDFWLGRAATRCERNCSVYRLSKVGLTKVSRRRPFTMSRVRAVQPLIQSPTDVRITARPSI